MSDFLYCPTCWPADAGEYDTDHRCLQCGTPVIAAGPDERPQLLIQQNAALTTALRESLQVIQAQRAEVSEARSQLRMMRGA